MIWLLALSISAQPDMSSIDIPYQAIPAFTAYSECVTDRFHDDERRRSSNVAEVRQANLDAIAATAVSS